jgi:chemosensory pili system protein ChpA (sensor histidine kinase/response regulator)
MEPIQQAVDRLRGMVEALARGEAPGSGSDEAEAVHALIKRFQASPPAPQEATKSALEGIELDLNLTPDTVDKEVEVKTAAPAPQPSGRELRKMHDDIDDQLLPIFLEEAQTLLPQIGSDIRDWKAKPDDMTIVQSLQRGMHTLKGSARMAGAIRLGELTHIMESRVEAALEKSEVTAELFAELEEKMDRLSLDLERMQKGPEPASAAAAPVAEQAQEAPAEQTLEATLAQAAPAAPRAEPPLPNPSAMLRVNADTLDHLINEAGEVAIARSRIEAELRIFKQSLGDLSESIGRLRGQLREVEVQADSQMQSRKSEIEERKTEYDPLEFDRYTRLQELTRMMAESLHDVNSIQQGLLKNLGDSDAALQQQARTSRDVQQELMRMRAVPFSNLNERLYRIVRQTSREVAKKAELTIEGAQVELDRGVLEKIGAPLEHMLRNSLAHGIEAPEARLAAGKPDTGKISITLRQESNEIALVISDDGAGIDLERIYKKAVEKGIVEHGQPLSDAEKAQLIFASGLSTADTVSEIAGRGVGMDVVRTDITSIGGRVDIATTRGKGTTFAVYLPLTLAVTQVVMVRAGQNFLAISAAMVENVLRLKADAMTSLYDRRMIDLQDRHYPLYYLAQLAGQTGATEIQPYNSVLLLRSGVQRIALHVDELIGNQEIVVKAIGPQLARVPGVSGATVLADGRIVLIVNPVQLVQHVKLAPPKPATAAVPVAAAAEAEKPQAPIVMVVDDSLTVRKITSRLLEREGYQVLTAKDGVDALQQLKDVIPAVMLVDIEMPRMDGFDLTKNVRSDPRTAGIPIVIISSRTADKHRNQAAQLGVNAFLGKPYQETELLQHIVTFVGAPSPAVTQDLRLH